MKRYDANPAGIELKIKNLTFTFCSVYTSVNLDLNEDNLDLLPFSFIVSPSQLINLFQHPAESSDVVSLGQDYWMLINLFF